jgi:hypothetical protein
LTLSNAKILNMLWKNLDVHSFKDKGVGFREDPSLEINIDFFERRFGYIVSPMIVS